MKRNTFLRLAGLLSLLCMWAMTPVVARAAEVAQASDTALEAGVAHTQISVSVTVYLTSILATASFTWAIAQHDSRREKRISHLEEQLVVLFAHLQSLSEDETQDAD